jgi:hypothetical protein
MLKFFKLIYNFIIPILISAFGIVLGTWLLLQFSQPQLVLYTDGYYQKTNGASIGEFYIVNEGRSQDKNITLAVNKEISAPKITIAYTNSLSTIKASGGYTYITIDTLNPNEGAEVIFEVDTKESSFTVEDFSSNSGNTSQRAWINPWWFLTKLQIILIIFLVTIGFGIGFFIGLWKNDLIKRNNTN